MKFPFSQKNGFLTHFKYYYSILGRKVFLFLVMCVGVSFLDGIGLAMFIPLLKAVGDGKTQAASDNHESMGQIQHVVTLIKKMGFELTITTVLVVLVLLFLFKGLIKYIMMKYYAAIRELFIKKVRYRLVNNLEGLSYSAFLKIDSGKIQNTLTVEVQRLFSSFHFYFIAAQAAVMLLTYMFLAFLANYQFAVLVCFGAVLSNLIYSKIYKTTKNASNDLSKKGADFNSFLIQTTHHFKYLKSTNTFNRYSGKLKTVWDPLESTCRHASLSIL